jgi:hypothetical protein
MNKFVDTSGHFGFTKKARGAVLGTSPMNAFNFGMVIQDRTLRGVSYGLRDTHIPFQYLEEGNLPNLTKSANYEDLQIPGRFENIQTYMNSNNVEFSLRLIYFAEGSESNNSKTKWTIEQISRISAKLESLVYPAYDGKFTSPPYCFLNIGKVFMDFPVIVRSVSIEHKAPFRKKDLMPYRRDITLDLKSFYPTYQAIGSRDVVFATTERGNRTVSKENIRAVYSFRRFGFGNR